MTSPEAKAWFDDVERRLAAIDRSYISLFALLLAPRPRPAKWEEWRSGTKKPTVRTRRRVKAALEYLEALAAAEAAATQSKQNLEAAWAALLQAHGQPAAPSPAEGAPRGS